MIKSSQIYESIFLILQDAFNFMSPYLSNYLEFSKKLSQTVQIKENDNIQYNFDVELDQIIKQDLVKHGLTGKIFSEESGFFENGSKKYRVIYDPFCNSSLASKTFHEAALGITIFDFDYNLITSAILDYQTGIVGIVEDNKTNFYQIQTHELIKFDTPLNRELKDSWLVVTLENEAERSGLNRVRGLLKESGRIIISSGHLYWLKLAIGMIDGYCDPIGGERLYEMFAATVAQHSGRIVTDLEGKDFDSSLSLKLFEQDPKIFYYPVAATNLKLHHQILHSIQK